jgi:TRAP-type transport system small permease protein
MYYEVGMSRIMKRIQTIETILSEIFLAGIVIFVFGAAVLRWFGISVAWSIDIAQLFFGWAVFLGADAALKSDCHIGVDMLVVRFPPKVRRIITFINYLAMAGFLILVTGYGVYLCMYNSERLFNTIKISYSFATASVPFGGTLMLITLVTKIWDLVKNRKEKASDEQKTECIF